MKNIKVFMVLFLSGITFGDIIEAQQKPEVKTPAVEVCSTKPDASGLTGCEQATLENFRLKQTFLQSQASQLQTQYNSISETLAKTITLIESQHPGMTYFPPDQNFPNGRIDKKPEPKVEEKKPVEKK